MFQDSGSTFHITSFDYQLWYHYLFFFQLPVERVEETVVAQVSETRQSIISIFNYLTFYATKFANK